MILDSVGKHVQLNKLDPNNPGDTFWIFTGNTADDVYMNDLGNTLTEFVPTVTSNVNVPGNPLTAKQMGVVSVSDTVYNALTVVPTVSP